jgi:hypothetical protein
MSGACSEEEEEEDLDEYAGGSSAVTEICDHVVLTLMTTLRDARATPSAFDRAADRLITYAVCWCRQVTVTSWHLTVFLPCV